MISNVYFVHYMIVIVNIYFVLQIWVTTAEATLIYIKLWYMFIHISIYIYIYIYIYITNVLKPWNLVMFQSFFIPSYESLDIWDWKYSSSAW